MRPDSWKKDSVLYTAVTFDSGDTACWQNLYDFEPQITEKEPETLPGGDLL